MLSPKEYSFLRGEIKLIKDEIELILRRLDYMDAQLQEQETVELPTYPYINPVVSLYACPSIPLPSEITSTTSSSNYQIGGETDETKT